jgi:hypothetical protein
MREFLLCVMWGGVSALMLSVGMLVVMVVQ